AEDGLIVVLLLLEQLRGRRRQGRAMALLVVRGLGDFSELFVRGDGPRARRASAVLDDVFGLRGLRRLLLGFLGRALGGRLPGRRALGGPRLGRPLVPLPERRHPGLDAHEGVLLVPLLHLRREAGTHGDLRALAYVAGQVSLDRYVRDFL